MPVAELTRQNLSKNESNIFILKPIRKVNLHKWEGKRTDAEEENQTSLWKSEKWTRKNKSSQISCEKRGLVWKWAFPQWSVESNHNSLCFANCAFTSIRFPYPAFHITLSAWLRLTFTRGNNNHHDTFEWTEGMKHLKWGGKSWERESILSVWNWKKETLPWNAVLCHFKSRMTRFVGKFERESGVKG